MNHHEAAAADIASARIAHRQREADRDSGIDRVAAVFENIGADLRRARLLRHDHAAMRDDALRSGDGIGGVLVAARNERQHNGCGKRKANKASRRE